VSRPGTDGGGAAVFEVALRNGIWQVARDGEFFGHYRGRGAAVAAAQDAARLPLSRATAAQVVICEDDA
jgi:hypothetical protein